MSGGSAESKKGKGENVRVIFILVLHQVCRAIFILVSHQVFELLSGLSV